MIGKGLGIYRKRRDYDVWGPALGDSGFGLRNLRVVPTVGASHAVVLSRADENYSPGTPGLPGLFKGCERASETHK